MLPLPLQLGFSKHFHLIAAVLIRTLPEALSPSHTSRGQGSATQDRARARGSNAAQVKTQDMEANSNLFGVPGLQRAFGQATCPHGFNIPDRFQHSARDLSPLDFTSKPSLELPGYAL